MYQSDVRREADPEKPRAHLDEVSRPGHGGPIQAAAALHPEKLVRVGPTVSELTGLASSGLLTLRLEEVYDHCHERGVRPSEAFALLLIQPDLGDRPRLARDAIRVMLADELRRTFGVDETQAEVGQRLVVLAAHTAGLRRASVGLVRRMRRIPALKKTDIQIWIRPLPDEPGELTRFVLELGL